MQTLMKKVISSRFLTNSQKTMVIDSPTGLVSLMATLIPTKKPTHSRSRLTMVTDWLMATYLQTARVLCWFLANRASQYFQPLLPLMQLR